MLLEDTGLVVTDMNRLGSATYSLHADFVSNRASHLVFTFLSLFQAEKRQLDKTSINCIHFLPSLFFVLALCCFAFL